MRELLPVLDDLERALEAAERARGGASSSRAWSSSSSRSRDALRKEGLVEIETDGAFDPHVHEALLTQPGDDAEPGSVLEVVQRGYRVGDKVVRPARVIVARMSSGANPYEVLGVAEERVRRRDQEGVPEARARVPPRRNPGDNGAEERFKEVQAAYDVLSDAEKRKAYDAFGADGRARLPRRGSGHGRSALRGVRPRRTSAISSAGCSAAGGRRAASSAADARRTISRRTSASRSRTRSRASQVRVPVEVETACSVCHGTGAEPGTSPITCPQCGGRGVVSRLAGPVRSLAAVPAVPRQRHDHREAVQTLRRLGTRARDEALRGEDPRRREGRHAHPAQGEGRGRAQRRPCRRSLRRRRRRPVAALRAPRIRPRARRAGDLSRRRRSARRSRSRRRRAPSRSRCRAAPRAGSSCASRGAARRT